MKLSVEKTTVAWVKVGFSVGAYMLTIVLAGMKSYIAFVPFGIAFILLGYALLDFQYLREKLRRLVLSYVILFWLSLWNLITLIFALQGGISDTGIDIFFYSFFPSIILSILAYLFIPKKVTPAVREGKKCLGEIKNISDTQSNFPINLSIDDLTKLTTPLKVTFSLLFLSNILAIIALPSKQYVSLAFVVPVVIATAILPLSKYLKEMPGRMSLAYIVLLSGSYFMILPALVTGITLNYEGIILYFIFPYIPLGLLAISLTIYLANRVNIDPILKTFLRKMYYERQVRTNTIKQLSNTEARKCKNQIYLAIFISLTVFNAISITISKFSTSSILGGNRTTLDEEFAFFISSSVAYSIVATLILKRFLPKARLYPLMLYHFSLLFALTPVYGVLNGDDGGADLIPVYAFSFLHLLFIGLAFVAYEIHRNITESKFVWRDAAVKVGTKK